MTTQLRGEAVGQRLQATFPDAVTSWDDNVVRVKPDSIVEICQFLKDTPDLDMDFLSSITGVDYVESFEVVYHLISLTHNHSVVLKTTLYGRDDVELPSVMGVWKGADLQEREVWDLMGIGFRGHPNMKRILTWEGFPGHPLRKDHLGG
jgi:NADH-quinone oxidoreductase subunit C